MLIFCDWYFSKKTANQGADGDLKRWGNQPHEVSYIIYMYKMLNPWIVPNSEFHLSANILNTLAISPLTEYTGNKSLVSQFCILIALNGPAHDNKAFYMYLPQNHVYIYLHHHMQEYKTFIYSIYWMSCSWE